MSNVQNINTELAEYKTKGNVLMPTAEITQVSPWHQTRITQVKISPNPDDGEVYKQGSKTVVTWINNKKNTAFVDTFSLGKVALMKIAQAAGIVWDHRSSGPMSLTRDYVSYKAVAMIRLPAGDYQPMMAIKEIDLKVIEAELMEQNLNKYMKLQKSTDAKDIASIKGYTQKEWAEMQTKTALIQWSKHKAARAETGAMQRVIRAALCIKQAYTEEELKKPFIVPRIDFAPDYSDPNVQRLMMEQGVRAMSALFATSPQIIEAQALTPIVAHDDEDYEDLDHDEAPAYEIEPEPQKQPEPEPEPESEEEEVGPNDCHGKGCHVKNLQLRVIQYSTDKYGKPLCYACQQKQ